METTIQIPSEMEAELAIEAEKSGLDLAAFVQNVLKSRLKPTNSAPSVSDREAELLQEIDVGFSESQMERYVGLLEKRRDGAATADELEELNKTTTELEKLNVKRVRAMSQLAKLRGVDLETVRRQLGIEPPDVL